MKDREEEKSVEERTPSFSLCERYTKRRLGLQLSSEKQGKVGET